MNSVVSSVINPEDTTVMFSTPIPLTGGDKGDKLVGVWLPSRLVADLHGYLDKVQCDMVEDVEFTNVISSFSSSRHMYLLQKEDGKVIKVKPNRQGSSRFKLCDVQCVRKDDDTGDHVDLFLWFKDFDRMTRFNTPPVIRSYFNEEELSLMQAANGEGGKASDE